MESWKSLVASRGSVQMDHILLLCQYQIKIEWKSPKITFSSFLKEVYNKNRGNLNMLAAVSIQTHNEKNKNERHHTSNLVTKNMQNTWLTNPVSSIHSQGIWKALYRFIAASLIRERLYTPCSNLFKQQLEDKKGIINLVSH